jgi:hypothetical protein
MQALSPRVYTTPSIEEDVENIPNLIYENDSRSESEDDNGETTPHKSICETSKSNTIAPNSASKVTPLQGWMSAYTSQFFSPKHSTTIIKPDAQAQNM